MHIKHILWISCSVIFLHCQTVNCENEKIRREVSKDSYKANLFGKDGSSIKSSGKALSPAEEVFSALGLKYDKNLMSTVEYWPPDMDKEKFFKMRDEMPSQFASWLNFKPIMEDFKEEPEIVQPVKEVFVPKYKSSVKEKSRKIAPLYIEEPKKIAPLYVEEPKKIVPVAAAPKKEIKYSAKITKPQQVVYNYNYDDFVVPSTESTPIEVINDGGYQVREPKVYNFPLFNEPSFVNPSAFYNTDFTDASIPSSTYSPIVPTTEKVLSFDAAMTDVGPHRFPTNEPTFPNPSNVAFIPRNKKRKLKKKVKTSSITQSVSPPPAAQQSAIDVTTETSFQYTPVHVHDIDNESIRYTDIISNLSDLTELSFNSNMKNAVNDSIEKVNSFDVNSSQNFSDNVINTSSSTPPFIINADEPSNSNNVKVTEIHHMMKSIYNNFVKTAEKKKDEDKSSTKVLNTENSDESKKSGIKSSKEVTSSDELKKALDSRDALKVKNKVKSDSKVHSSKVATKSNLKVEELPKTSTNAMAKVIVTSPKSLMKTEMSTVADLKAEEMSIPIKFNVEGLIPSTSTASSTTQLQSTYRSRFGIRKFKKLVAPNNNNSRPSSVATTVKALTSTVEVIKENSSTVASTSPKTRVERRLTTSTVRQNTQTKRRGRQTTSSGGGSSSTTYKTTKRQTRTRGTKKSN